MRQRDVIFILVVAGVVGLLYYLSQTPRKFKRIPQDEIHSSVKTEQECLECHILPASADMAKAAPGHEWQGARRYTLQLPKEHPNKFQCFRCHKRQ